MKNYNLLYLMSSFLFIFGCDGIASNKASSDANARMNMISKNAERNASKYEMSIPKVEPYREYNIKSELEDPFTVLSFAYTAPENDEAAQAQACKNSEAGCGNAPDYSRKKEFLEQYELSALAYVGSMDKEGEAEEVALVRTPDVGVVQIKKGQYIGKNDGLILKVLPRALVISEKVKQGQFWQDRQRNLLITK